MTATQPRSLTDVVASVRRSIISVKSANSGGTAWVALGNGLLLTSHEAVGYQLHVELETEQNKKCEGRVIWTDVPRDLALVLPSERLGISPLLPRPDLPRLGEPALSIEALPGEPWRVASGLVSAVDFKVGNLRCFEVDAPIGSRGGPIFDLDGRIIGVGGLDLPRGSRKKGEAVTAARSPAIPIVALQRALAAVDLPIAQFEGRVPTYRCPSCNESFAGDFERCGSCGRTLPGAFSYDVEGQGPALGAAARLVRELLEEVGSTLDAARVGPRAYLARANAPQGTVVQVSLEVDALGETVRGKLPLAKIPSQNHEPFYRFLLSLNDQGLTTQRLGVEGEVVFLSFSEPTTARAGEGAARLQDTLREGERFQKALLESFEATAPG